jgi:hypothetical protein
MKTDHIYYLAAIVVLALAVWGSNARAETSFCKQVETLAESVMTARQKGVPLSKIIEIAEESEIGDTIRAMAMEAYSGPAYSTREYQDRKIRQFTDDWYLACLRKLGD